MNNDRTIAKLIQKILKNKLFQQILRFLFVGGTAFIIDFGVLWFLTEHLSLPYLISNCISFTFSVIYNYIMSVCWVFETQQTRNKATELFVFVILSVIGLGINQGIMWISVELLSINYLLSKIFATIIVMVFNFITRKKFLE